MTKFILLYLLPLLFSSSMLAQVCTVQRSVSKHGVVPTTLPQARAGVAYDEDLTIFYPRDTFIGNQRIRIDSVRLLRLEGLPTGFSYSCNTLGCTWKSGTKGCFNIQGRPQQAASESYALRAVFLLQGPQGKQYQTSSRVRLQVEAGARAGETSAQLHPNYPNPFAEETTFSFYLPNSDDVELSIYNLIGNELFNTRLAGKAGFNEYFFTNEELQPGMYFYRLQYKDQVLTRRMTIGN